MTQVDPSDVTKSNSAHIYTVKSKVYEGYMCI